MSLAQDTLGTVRLAMSALERPEGLQAAEVDQAIAEIESQLPLKRSEPGLDGQISRMIEDTLRPIGAALDPRIAPEQAKVWRKALLLKLSNLPGTIVLKATRKATHDPFHFFSEVEPAIRSHAEAALKHQAAALMRLKRWRAELERLANPLPAIEAPPEEPVTQDEIDRMNVTMRRIGSNRRWRLADGEAELFDLEEPETPQEPEA
jgi:hypothetical protein